MSNELTDQLEPRNLSIRHSDSESECRVCGTGRVQHGWRLWLGGYAVCGDCEMHAPVDILRLLAMVRQAPDAERTHAIVTGYLSGNKTMCPRCHASGDWSSSIERRGELGLELSLARHAELSHYCPEHIDDSVSALAAVLDQFHGVPRKRRPVVVPQPPTPEEIAAQAESRRQADIARLMSWSYQALTNHRWNEAVTHLAAALKMEKSR